MPPTSRFEKQQELKLQYQAVVDAMIEPMHIVNKNLEILFVNKAFKQWSWNLQLESSIIGRSLFSVYPLLPDKIQDEYQHVLTVGEPLITEETHKIGTKEILIQVQKAPIFHEGKIKWVITTYRSITEHRKMEKSMRDAKERLRLLAEQSILGIAILQDGLIKYVNDALAKIIEYSPEEMLRWGPDEFVKTIHPEDRALVIEQAQKKQLGESDVIVHSSYRVITKNGKIKRLENYSKTIMYEGKPADFITLIDITERKIAEAALRESEERLRAFMDSATDGFSLWDSKLNLIAINKIGLELIPKEIRNDGLIGRNLMEFGPSARRPKNYDMYVDVIRTGNPLILEAVIPDPMYGNIQLAVKAFKVGDGLGIIVSDITDRKRAEQALQESEERLRAFMDSATDGFSLWDSKLNLIEVNQAGMQLIPPEIKKNGVIGVNLLEFDLTKTKGTYEKYTNVIKTGKPYFVADSVPHPIYGEKHFSIKAFKVGDGMGMAIADITDHKRAERALQESEEKYRSFVENFQGIAFKGYEDYSLDFFHGNVEEISGYTEDDFVSGRVKFKDLIHPKDSHRVANDVAEFHSSSRESTQREYRIIDKYRNIHWLLADIKKFTKGGVYGTIQDITDRKKTEEFLKESEATIRSITESSIDHISVIDLDFKILFINRIEHGFTKEQLMGIPIYNFLPPDLQNRVKGYYEEVIETRRPKTHEIYIVTPNGDRIDYESIAAPLVVNNKVTGLVINSRDITERKEAEKALKQVDDELHLSDELLKQMPDAIVLVDEQKKITRWMGSSEKIFGYSTKEAIGQLVSFIQKYPEIQHDIDSILNISGEYYGEVLCLRKDGSEVPIELTAKVIHNKDGKPIATIGINRDISVRKKAERARHEYLTYQSNFVYMTSHELRTPLTVIRGYADFLSKNYKSLDPKHVQQSLKAIVKSVDRLETLISDVKDLSLLEKELFSLDLEEFDFCDFINEIIANYKIILKEQLQFFPFSKPSPIVVNGDRIRLQQVFDNIISNAMKFTFEELRKITVTLERETNIVRIIIADNGAGIEIKNINAIFDQFTSFDTEYAVKGTGIGLFIAKEIIDDHGGNLHAESKGKGKGAKFFVEIPILTNSSIQNKH